MEDLAVGIEPRYLPVRLSFPGVLVVEPYAWLTPVPDGALALVLVGDLKLLLGT